MVLPAQKGFASRKAINDLVAKVFAQLKNGANFPAIWNDMLRYDPLYWGCRFKFTSDLSRR
jgi:hypothetical protein